MEKKVRVKYTEESYKKEVESLYNGEFEVVGRYTGLYKPILIQSKFGLLQPKTAKQVLNYEPTINVAVDKASYFYNQLKDKYPEIAKTITPISEYINARTKMLFKHKFGIVTTTPDSLLAGHTVNIRSAVNRKEFFYNQLKYLYQNEDYDFIISSTSRHEGRVTLICPIHGDQSIDSDWIFSGCGCPECNTGWEKSTSLYIVKLTHEINGEKFYKLGVSYITDSGEIRRYRDYRSLGYLVEEIHTSTYENFEECIDTETELKRVIKEFVITPKIWPNKSSTECFKNDIIEVLVAKL